MADDNNTDDAKAAADAKKKERAEKAAAKGLAGKKKSAEPTGPAPKYKREKTPRLKAKYDENVRAAMISLTRLRCRCRASSRSPSTWVSVRPKTSPR
jgi:hypothetical protein